MIDHGIGPSGADVVEEEASGMGIVEQLGERLAGGEVVIIDGGMGSELQARGVPMTHEAWCGLANLEYQDVVRSIHRDFIRAGADVIIANTYPTAPFALQLAGFGDRVEEVNRRAVEAAFQARDEVADHPIIVAGSMSHWGLGDARRAGLLPNGDQDVLAAYRQQAAILAEAGVDLLILETFEPGWLLALQAVGDTGLPFWIGPVVRLDTDGSVLSANLGDVPETDFDEALPMLLGPGVTAVTVMHSEIDTIAPALEAVRRHWSGPIGAYPHVGSYTRPHWTFSDITAPIFAAEAQAWVEMGAQLIGGCCGIRPDHIRAIKEQLPSRIPIAARG